MEAKEEKMTKYIKKIPPPPKIPKLPDINMAIIMKRNQAITGLKMYKEGMNYLWNLLPKNYRPKTKSLLSFEKQLKKYRSVYRRN